MTRKRVRAVTYGSYIRITADRKFFLTFLFSFYHCGYKYALNFDRFYSFPLLVLSRLKLHAALVLSVLGYTYFRHHEWRTDLKTSEESREGKKVRNNAHARNAAITGSGRNFATNLTRCVFFFTFLNCSEFSHCFPKLNPLSLISLRLPTFPLSIYATEIIFPSVVISQFIKRLSNTVVLFFHSY